MSETFDTTRRWLEHLAGRRLPGWRAFARGLRRVELPPRATVFAQGVAHPYVYVIAKGLVKLAYVDERGREGIKSILAEGQFFASLAALEPRGITRFSAQSLEACVLERIDARQWLARIDRLPWLAAYAAALRVHGARKELREHELLMLAPSERVRLFFTRDESLARRLPQTAIAAYLGLTAVGLSRILGRLRATGRVPAGGSRRP